MIRASGSGRAARAGAEAAATNPQVAAARILDARRIPLPVRRARVTIPFSFAL
jgi:hypothetical protein